MWGANDHQAADVAVRRDVANFRKTAWAQEALALHLRVTYAQRRRRGIGEAHREAHDHEVCSGIRGGSAAGSRDGALGWGRNEFEQQILEVTFVHRDTELSCKAYENGSEFATDSGTHLPFCRTGRDISSSLQRALLSRFVCDPLRIHPGCHECFQGRRWSGIRR